MPKKSTTEPYEMVMKVFDLSKDFKYILSGTGRERQKKNSFQLSFPFLVCENFGIWFSFGKCKKRNTTSVKMKYNNRFLFKAKCFRENSNYNVIVLSNCYCLLEGFKCRIIVDLQKVWGATPDNL